MLSLLDHVSKVLKTSSFSKLPKFVNLSTNISKIILKATCTVDIVQVR